MDTPPAASGGIAEPSSVLPPLPPLTTNTSSALPPPPRNSSYSHTCSISISPVSLVINECSTVTSAMRKNARWAQSGVASILGVPNEDSAQEDIGLIARLGLRAKRPRTTLDNPLLTSFAKLRADLADCRDISLFDTPSLFHPFLQVIRSSSITGPITSLALNAITKFFAYRIISVTSPRLPLAMQLLSSAITHCRFEASDSAQDEVVLLRILRLMEVMMCGVGGNLLSDESVCEMMETGLSMCCQMRLSEMLRRSAEMSMITMCQKAFEFLKQIEPEQSPTTIEEMTTVTQALSTVQMGEPAAMPPNGMPITQSAGGTPPDPTPTTVQPQPEAAGNSYADVDLQPYGLPSIRELLRVLISLLDPHDRQHTDAMRVMSLRIIDVAFEVAGATIAAHASLRILAADDLCRHLFQLIRYDSPQVLHTSLRVASTVLHTMRPHLKLQQELLLSYIISCLYLRVDVPKEPGVDPILYDGITSAIPTVLQRSPSVATNVSSNSGTSTPVPLQERQKLGMEGGFRGPDARETMVEWLSGLTRIPSFMVDLFVNYDCDVERMDLCADLISLLSRNAFPDAALYSTPNVPPLCLDALLSYVLHMVDRVDLMPMVKDGYPTVEQLNEIRSQKDLLVKGTAQFNENPKQGIKFLVENGIIDDEKNAEAISTFLHHASRISKKLIGDYLSKPSNIDILNCFIDNFDFKDKRMDTALRELLSSFRLPGEAQQIARILEKFSERYCEFEPKEVASKDAAFVLSYSIIMLNTDQHNPQVRKRMTFDEYRNNLRGVNDKKDFAPEYLENIYNTIKHHEIIMPEEHDTQVGFEYSWKELMQKAEFTGEMRTCADTNLYDAAMFRATWKPVVSALAFVFTSATDDMVIMRVITGFDHCARIATAYGLSDILDHIILCLAKISTLAVVPTANSTANSTEIQVDGSSITVSELSVQFGRNYKAQLATVVLFRVVRGNETLVRAGWREIILIWLSLFANSLISPYFSELQDSLNVPAIPMITPGNIIKRNDQKDGGLLSTLSSYLSSYAVDGPPEPTDEELESTLCTVDCVNSCSMSEIFDNISALDSVKLRFMMQSLLEEAMLLQNHRPFLIMRNELAHSDSNITEDAQSGKSESPASSMTGYTQGDRPKVPSLAPLSIYVLEMATCLALKDKESLDSLRGTLLDAFKAILANQENIFPIVAGRVACYMLAILRKTIADFPQDPSEEQLKNLNDLISEIFLSISSVDHILLKESSPFIARTLSSTFRESSQAAQIMMVETKEQAFWKALEILQEHYDAASIIFELVEFITDFVRIDELEARDESSLPTLTRIRNSDTFQAIIDLLGAFASAGNIGSEWEQRHDQRANGSRRMAGRPATPPISRSGSVVGTTGARNDRRNYSTLGQKGVVAAVGSTRNSEDSMRGTAMINGKLMTAAEVNAAVASGTYPGMQRPYVEIVHRAVKSVKMMSEFRHYANKMITSSNLSRKEGWEKIWFPILDGLLLQCLNACREVRQQSFGSLQSTLLSPDVTSTYDDYERAAIFDTVLFPLISGLLKPEVYQSDPRGMGETRLQSASLMCKVFLYYLESLNGRDALWARILDMMDRLMNSNPRDNIEEAVTELIKNVVLVMGQTH
ncbi:uncharacterized protein V1518DRAFT_440749 [Limtongia smithiae]|uniref:uncharacterized protein n=1 Tax=Limtongia smithiae TaxID=1125753 RepID=UPI0034CE754A